MHYEIFSTVKVINARYLVTKYAIREPNIIILLFCLCVPGLTPLNVNANNNNDTTELPTDFIARVVEGSPVLSHDQLGNND